MKHNLQVELAQWIERLRSDVSVIGPFCDWLDENDIQAQQWKEARKLLFVAKYIWVMQDKTQRKFFGSSYFCTKFKVVCITQHGFSYELQIRNRRRWETNESWENNKYCRKLT